MVKADERHYLLDQWIADQGAIVVAIDNRGTPRRGRAWERAIKGRFADLPLDDQVARADTRWASVSRNWISIASGCSAGRSVATWRRWRCYAGPTSSRSPRRARRWSTGCDYDTHYTERYLDLPERNP